MSLYYCGKKKFIDKFGSTKTPTPDIGTPYLNTQVFSWDLNHFRGNIFKRMYHYFIQFTTFTACNKRKQNIRRRGYDPKFLCCNVNFWDGFRGASWGMVTYRTLETTIRNTLIIDFLTSVVKFCFKKSLKITLRLGYLYV